MDASRVAIKNHEDYDAMSEIMWCGSVSHSNFTELGRGKDFSVHKLGHELSARFDATHGASLTALWAPGPSTSTAMTPPALRSSPSASSA